MFNKNKRRAWPMSSLLNRHSGVFHWEAASSLCQHLEGPELHNEWNLSLIADIHVNIGCYLKQSQTIGPSRILASFDCWSFRQEFFSHPPPPSRRWHELNLSMNWTLRASAYKADGLALSYSKWYFCNNGLGSEDLSGYTSHVSRDNLAIFLYTMGWIYC